LVAYERVLSRGIRAYVVENLSWEEFPTRLDMKLIYVSSSLPYGPGEAQVIPEREVLTKQGHKVIIVPMYPRGSVLHGDAKALMESTITQPLLSVNIVEAVIAEFLRAPIRVLRVLGWLFQSRSLVILLKNLAIYPKGLWLARLARRWKANHIHAHWAAVAATMALIASEVSGIPWSFTARRWDILEDNLLSLKMVHASFARIISQSGLEMIKELGIEVPDDRIPILHVGVHLPTRFQAPKDQQEEINVPIILCPAGLRPIKGHKYLIEAFAILRGRSIESKLWLAGQGELRQALQEQVETLGLLDRVAFLGQLPHLRLLDLYSQGKIAMVVLPSLHEGIPVSLIEAMAYGVPVISTVAGGTPELLERGAGLLVPPEDPLALANAIERLVRDPGLRKQLVETGRRRVEDSFAVEKVVAELVRRFEACIGGEA
jgi:colanic acid/amylovoran biosynthesis glycosyltransferase